MGIPKKTLELWNDLDDREKLKGSIISNISTVLYNAGVRDFSVIDNTRVECETHDPKGASISLIIKTLRDLSEDVRTKVLESIENQNVSISLQTQNQ